jgi:hypothetical protein
MTEEPAQDLVSELLDVIVQLIVEGRNFLVDLPPERELWPDPRYAALQDAHEKAVAIAQVHQALQEWFRDHGMGFAYRRPADPELVTFYEPLVEAAEREIEELRRRRDS